jgi:phage-related protein
VPDKALFWLGTSRADLAAFPDDARRVSGFQLRRVQQGLAPNDWKPMTRVGPGVREIRVHTALEHRILYVATFADGVYVLHAFEKRSRATKPSDLQLARVRFRALTAWRRTRDERKPQA